MALRRQRHGVIDRSRTTPLPSPNNVTKPPLRMLAGIVDDLTVMGQAALRDPNEPKQVRKEFDPGDHLHPNDMGYQAIADAVDLSIFTGKRAAAAKR